MSIQSINPAAEEVLETFDKNDGRPCVKVRYYSRI
jgi:hypothetical protein